MGKTDILSKKSAKYLAPLKICQKLNFAGQKKVEIYILNHFCVRFFSAFIMKFFENLKLSFILWKKVDFDFSRF